MRTYKVVGFALPPHYSVLPGLLFLREHHGTLRRHEPRLRGDERGGAQPNA